jgi:hypothetical protein
MLREYDIECYLDVLDGDSRQANSEQITKIITENISKSTHLIAVTSRNTDASWWVPFEIGEATITNCRIATYRKELTNLPEYLHQWPAMKRLSDLESFIRAYKQDSRNIIFGSMESRSHRSTNITESSADTFHKDLKRRLNQ